MAANSSQYDEMDEAEEEALLRSDDEPDSLNPTRPLVGVASLPTPLDEDSLMREAAALDDQRNVAEGISADDDDDDSDSDDSDDGDDGDDEGKGNEDDSSDSGNEDQNLDKHAKILLEYESILELLERNQYAYDNYVRLCELSHRTNDLDKIRHAYQLFASVYPLTSELWLKYLRIEAHVAFSAAEMEQMEKWFRRAMADYYSIDLALEFANLAPRCANPMAIWQELLGTYGFNCLRGHQFFDLYRKYLPSAQNLSAENKRVAYAKSFMQQLRYPLKDMADSYIEFKVYCEKNKSDLGLEIDWESLNEQYFKAKEDLEKILPFEEKLLELDPKCFRERQEVYATYIKETDKFLDENILQTIYERMVADNCLNPDVWIIYVDFLEYRDEFGKPKELQSLPLFKQTALDVTKRALRNCTWADKIYIKRMQILEKLGKTRDQVQEVLESSMAAGFQTPEPAVAIWIEYLTYLRRHTDFRSEGECDILRKNFNLAWTILGKQWDVLADCNCEILQFWGRLEYGPLEDPKRGKELWTTVMESSDNATKSGLWIEFIQLEMKRDFESTRNLFQKALHSAGLDNPLVIASAWERFERCHGSIKNLNACRKETSAFLASLQQSSLQESYMKTHKAHSGKNLKRKPQSAIEKGQGPSAEKKFKAHEPKTQEAINSSHAAALEANAKKHREVVSKQHEDKDIDMAKDHLRIFLSNIDYNLTEDQIREGLSDLKITDVNLIRSGNGRSRGFGYLELETEAEVEKALSMDRCKLYGRPVFISSVLRDKEKRQKFKYSEGMEPKKLFVKGLPHDATKDELENIFGGFGKLVDIRLVYHKSGKFKNIAYVEYEEESSAGKAVLAVDKMELRDHVLSVSISAPPPKPATSAAAQSINRYVSKIVKPAEPKPRMSFIPSAVRKKFQANPAASATNGNAGANAESSPSKELVKTNEDFRKMLLK